MDRLTREIKGFLSALGEETLDSGQTRRAVAYIAIVSDLENIGDFVDKTLADHLRRLDERGQRFSGEGVAELRTFLSEVGSLYREGMTVTGTVARLAQFGAFVTIDAGIDGLLPIGKLGGGKRLKHPREVLQEGQQLLVVIESIDREQRRIALGLAGEGNRDEGPTSYTAPAATMGTFGDLLRKKLEQGQKK